MIIQNFIFEILKEYIIKKNNSPSETLTTKLAPTNVWLSRCYLSLQVSNRWCPFPISIVVL